MPLLRTNGKYVIVGVPPEPFELHSFAVVFSECRPPACQPARPPARLPMAAVRCRAGCVGATAAPGGLLGHACRMRGRAASCLTLTACLPACPFAATRAQSASAWAAA